jgi:orotidine-5'-phosphate decarboxylase
MAFDLKIPLELPEYARQMAVLAQETGLDGAVCSPRKWRNCGKPVAMTFCLSARVYDLGGPRRAIRGDRSPQLKLSKLGQITSLLVVPSLPLLTQSQPGNRFA